MSIHVHRAGLNKTLGHQSDAVVTDNLIGHWQPDQNWRLSPNIVWGNKVAGENDLRRFNSITRGGSGTGTYVAFDGTDDYVGPASIGYGGDPFQIDRNLAWTVNLWYRYGSTSQYWGNAVWGLGNYFYSKVLKDSENRKVRFHYGNTTYVESISSLTADTWYYLTVTHDGSDNYQLFINGKFEGSDSLGGITGTDNQSLALGRIHDGAYKYAISSTRIGRVHVYDKKLNASGIRQNFYASHDMHDTRIYGALG
ncbi:MAG: hypothetical protein H8E12_04100 [Rhodobacteraceae bacterium]|nr:hypothetical protein [Paracoccaceae bacterium]